MITNTTSLHPDQKVTSVLLQAPAVHQRLTLKAASQTSEGLQPCTARRRDLQSYHYYGFELKVYSHRSRTLWPGQP